MPTDDAMHNRYVGDIGDYVKLSILRALSPGYRLGVAWWLYPDESHNKDGRHIGYLGRPDEWRHFDPGLFDALAQIVKSDRRDVRALETADVLPGATFASEVIPVGGPIADRPNERRQWFTRVQSTLEEANMMFVDPDNGLEPAGYSHASSKAGKSILISELQPMTRPGGCLIVYHHHTRRVGGHHSEIEYWAARLRGIGFATVDVLRAKPYSPRVFFLLDAPPDVRQRAEQIALKWTGRITWHPDRATGGDALPFAPSARQLTPISAVASPMLLDMASEPSAPLPPASEQSARRGRGASTQVGYVNRNGQAVIRSTDNPGTDNGQYVYVLRCQACGLNTARTARTYGCDGVQGTIGEHRALHSESVESLRCRHLPSRSDSPDANQASAGC